MGFGGVPPMFVPEDLQTISQPKALKTGSPDWVRVEREQFRPEFSPPGQGGILAQELEHAPAQSETQFADHQEDYRSAQVKTQVSCINEWQPKKKHDTHTGEQRDQRSRAMRSGQQ